MNTARTPGQPWSAYRAEYADYSRILMNGEREFEVHGRDGLVRTYSPQDALEREFWNGLGEPQPDDPGLPVHEGFGWYLTKVADHFGNEMTVSYTAFSHSPSISTELLPLNIRYAGGSKGVDFEYSQESRTQSIKRCVSGLCFAEFPLLTSVTIVLLDEQGAHPQWEYELSYENGLETNRSRLSSLKWCESGGKCLPATTFMWKGIFDHNGAEARYRQVWFSEPLKIDPLYWPTAFMADVDGDGRDDLLYTTQKRDSDDVCYAAQTSPGAQQAFLLRSKGLWRGQQRDVFHPPVDVSEVFRTDNKAVNFSPGKSRFGDFDNDNASELLAFNADFDATFGTYVYAEWDHATQKFQPAPADSSFDLTSYGRSESLDVADVNADGLSDLVVSSSGAVGDLSPGTYLRKATPFGPNTSRLGSLEKISFLTCQAEPDKHITDFDGDGIFSVGCWAKGELGPDPTPDDGWLSTRGMGPLLFADINGDGLRDRILTTNANELKVALNSGHGYRPTHIAFSGSLPQGIGFSEVGELLVADFNGDGREDILVQWSGRQSDDSSVCQSEQEPEPPTILVSDGDRFRVWEPSPGVDLFEDIGPRLHPASGFRTDFSTVYPSTAVGDVNGDGLPEVLFLTYDNGSVRLRLFALTGRNSSGSPYGELQPDLLTEIRDEYRGIGAREQVKYASLARSEEDPANEDDVYVLGDDCQWPSRCLTDGLAVVRSYSGASSDYRTWEYQYEDGRTDLGGRGFLGFKCVTRVEEESGKVIKNCYDNEKVQAKACPGWIYPLAGVPKSMEVRSPIYSDLSKVRVSRTDYEYYPVRWMNHAVYTVERKSATTTLYEGAPVDKDLRYANKVHRDEDLQHYAKAEYSYDSHGNVVQMHDTVKALGDVYETDTFRRYRNNTAPPYKLGLLTSEEVQKKLNGGNLTKRTSEYAYSAEGALVKHVRQPQGTADQKRTLTLTRNARGLVTKSSVEVAGLPAAVTKYEYDEDNVRLRKITNPLGHVAHVGIHPALGVPVITRDANGVTTFMKYDFLGRLREVDGPGLDDLSIDYGGGDFAKSLVGFDSRIAFGTYAVVRRPGSGFAIGTFDKEGRRVETFRKHSDGRLIRWSTEYDEDLGFPTGETLPRDVESTEVLKFNTISHDLLGRVTAVVDHDSTSQEWLYPSPFETRHTDEVGDETITHTNVMGLV